MTAAGSANGFGTTAWWGFSPALDLQATCLESSMEHLQPSQEGIPELNILLVGSIDGRHILKTMSRLCRWPRKKINFYVLENNLETVGRQLLFLSLALESSAKMGLQEKSETLLELMGNTFIRSQTASYLQEKASLFIRYVTDSDFQVTHLPSVDLSALKFKERDQLESIFRFWRNPNPQTFQIKQLWDLRLRQYLGSRYDARRGVCDWDLTMKLHEHGANVINIREFFHWRDTGIAFEMREGAYDIPNKTLASGRLLRHKGEPLPARGYWGDIATGPYITFGIESEDPSLLKITNGIPSKSSQDISLHNITALLSELQNNAHYDPLAPSNEDGSGDYTRLDASNGTDFQFAPRVIIMYLFFCSLAFAQSDFCLIANNTGPFTTEDIRVCFLPLNCLSELHHKGKYRQFFNLIFFSCSMVHFLQPNLNLMSATKASLIVELTNFLPDLRKEQLLEFSSRVTNLAREAGFVPVQTTDKKIFSLFELGVQEAEEIHSNTST